MVAYRPKLWFRGCGFTWGNHSVINNSNKYTQLIWLTGAETSGLGCRFWLGRALLTARCSVLTWVSLHVREARSAWVQLSGSLALSLVLSEFLLRSSIILVLQMPMF